nr:MAG TPA: immunity protein [Caudoviricetes sp.]
MITPDSAPCGYNWEVLCKRRISKCFYLDR